MIRRKEKLATTLEGLEAQGRRFLEANGFPATDKYLQVFGTFVQHLPPDQDWFDPKHTARMIRKAESNEAAFYLVNPKARKQMEEAREQEVGGKVAEKA